MFPLRGKVARNWTLEISISKWEKATLAVSMKTTTSSHSKHGGKRKGAGKPAQFEKPMKRKEVMLPDKAIEFFLVLGNGNFSAGVRQAWRSLIQRVKE